MGFFFNMFSTKKLLRLQAWQQMGKTKTKCSVYVDRKQMLSLTLTAHTTEFSGCDLTPYAKASYFKTST